MRIRFSYVFTVIFGVITVILLSMRGMTEETVMDEHSLRDPKFLKAVLSELLLNPHMLTDPEISYELHSLLNPLCNSWNANPPHQPIESTDPVDIVASPSATSSPSASATPTSSPTSSPSATPTSSPSRTPSSSGIPDPSPSKSPSSSRIPKPSKSPTSSPSVSPTPVIESMPSVSSTPSPSPASPSASPTPMAKYIRNNLEGGPFPRPKPFSFKTTINTGITIHFEDLASHPDLPAGDIKRVDLEPNLSNGTAVIQETSIMYTPFKWFEGVDNITCSVVTTDDEDEEVTTQIDIPIYVRIPVLMTKSILDIPEGYEIREIGRKMTQEMGKSLKNETFAALIPESDYWLSRRYSSCAVIGSGGSLKHSKRGKEIDSHEIVVRFNLAPFFHENFTEDVGTHLNIRFTNGGLSPLCWKPGTFDLPSNTSYEIMAQATTAAQFDKYAPCVEKKSFYHYHMMSYLWVDLVDSILLTYVGKDRIPRFRSTGMIAVTSMLTVCDHVSMYGFENGADNTHHYWETVPGKREWINHSYSAEKEYYKDLAKGDGLFMKHLSKYDLYKSFKYIVD